MGWTYEMSGKLTRAEIKERMLNIFTWENEHRKVRPLYISLQTNVAYLALELTADGVSQVFAEVVLYKNTETDGFGYKEMCETMRPCEDHAPKKLIEMLTPINSEWANEWRQSCLANATSKGKSALSVPLGAQIELTDGSGERLTAYSFNGHKRFKINDQPYRRSAADIQRRGWKMVEGNHANT